MPFKNYQDKIRYNNLHNPDRVGTGQGKNFKRITLNNIISRTYVCSFCGEYGYTAFHHPTNDIKFVIELCNFCHDSIHNHTFDETKLFL